MPSIRANHLRYHNQQANHKPHHCCCHAPPLLPWLLNKQLWCLHSHLLHTLQLRRAWCRYQPLSPWRRLRCDRTCQDSVGANLSEHRLLRRHFGSSHSWSKYVKKVCIIIILREKRMKYGFMGFSLNGAYWVFEIWFWWGFDQFYGFLGFDFGLWVPFFFSFFFFCNEFMGFSLNGV